MYNFRIKLGEFNYGKQYNEPKQYESLIIKTSIYKKCIKFR